MDTAGNTQQAPGGARADDRTADATTGSGGAASERAVHLRQTLRGRRDVEALLAEAGRVRDAAAAEADALVAEAQQIAEELVFESQQWAEQLTVEAHERAEEVLLRAREEAAKVEQDAQWMWARAEQERRDVEQSRGRGRGLIEQVEQAVGRLRAGLEPEDDVRRAEGFAALFERSEPPAGAAAPAATPRVDRGAEPSLAELFPEPESQRPALPEVVEGREGSADEEGSGPAFDREFEPEFHTGYRTAREPEVEPARDRPTQGQAGTPREGNHRPLGWLFRSQAP